MNVENTVRGVFDPWIIVKTVVRTLCYACVLPAALFVLRFFVSSLFAILFA